MSDCRERAGFLAFRLEPVGGLRGLPWLGALWAGFALAVYHLCTGIPFLSASVWLRSIFPFWRMSVSTLCQHAGYVARLAVFVALASALGRGLLRRALRVDGLNAFETYSFGFGLGLGVISLMSFALGIFQQFKPTAVFILTAILTLFALWLNATAPAQKAQDDDPNLILSGRGCVLMAVLTAFILLIEGFYALAPETSFDALVYHLSLPSLYRLSGGIVATPTSLYSGFPMLLEWVYGFMLFFSDEIAAKLIHWACGVGIAAAFLGMGLRSRRPLMGWVACVVFLSAPLTIYNIVSADTDVGSAYFVLLAAYSVALYCGCQRDAAGARWLVLSAVLCGLAMGIKYTNWPLLPLLALVLFLMKKPKRDIRRFGIIAACVLLPWMIKNVFLYRNPIFPFLHDSIVSNPEFSPGWRLLGADAGGRDWIATLASSRMSLEAFLHPWFMTMFDTSHSGHLGPIFLMVLPAFLFIRPASAATRLWLSCLFGLWLAWWLTSAMPRLFLPGLCLFSVFVGAVVEKVENRWRRRALLAVLTVITLNGVSAASWMISKTGVCDYLVGGTSKEEFLRPSRPLWPNSYYYAAEWINKNTPATARVLVLNGGRGYYLERSFLTSSRLDEDLLAHWLKKSRTSDDLLQEFERAGVTHILINMAWLWGQGVPDPGVKPAQFEILEDFFNRFTRLRYNDLHTALGATRWTDVYEIVPESDRPQPVIKPLLRWYRMGGLAGLGANGQSVLEYDSHAR
jgi:4-amino-4-deoxy-L-arabinose transferase-like glycosyltransferase